MFEVFEEVNLHDKFSTTNGWENPFLFYFFAKHVLNKQLVLSLKRGNNMEIS